MDEITYRCKDIPALARRIAGSLYTDQIISFALTSDPDEVLCEVDTYGHISPTSGKTIYEIRVLPSVHAEDLARRIWDRLDWDEVAINGDIRATLERHIFECGLTFDEAYSCPAVQNASPQSGSSPGIGATGWSISRIVW